MLTGMTHKEISGEHASFSDISMSQTQYEILLAHPSNTSTKIASGQDAINGYELCDLVVLSSGGSASEVRVIVRVGHEELSVVKNHGIAGKVRPEELCGKRNKPSDRAMVLDVQANHIRCGESVTIVETRVHMAGEEVGRRGRLLGSMGGDI